MRCPSSSGIDKVVMYLTVRSMLGLVSIFGVDWEAGVWDPAGLRHIGEGAMDDKNSVEGNQNVEPDPPEAVVGIPGEDDSCDWQD